MQSRILLATLFLLLVGCGSQGTSMTNLGFINFDCYLASAAECNSGAAGKTVYVGINSNSSSACTTLITAAGTNFGSQFAAWGTTTAAWDSADSLVSGSVGSWENSAGQSIQQLAVGTYRVCAFLDSNGNLQLDSGEPFFSQALVLSSPMTISSWQQYDPGLPPAILYNADIGVR